MRGRGRVVVAAGLALMLAGAGCGGDGADGEGDRLAFCRLLASVGSDPSDEQLAQVLEAAPPEIAEDVETLAEVASGAGDDPEAAVEAFQDEDLVNAATRVQKFQTEQCPGTTTTPGAGNTAPPGARRQ